MPAPMTPPPKKPFNWGKFSKNASFWILVFLIPIALMQLFGIGRKSDGSPEINFTAYHQQLEQPAISKPCNLSRMVILIIGHVLASQFALVRVPTSRR